jgi:flagellar transcriptional activator FlhD
MNTDQMMNEIRETNLAYLMLAQTMIRADKSQALFRLGLSEEVADLVAQLSPQQLVRIAAQNVMMCRFRFDDEMVWGLLTSHGRTVEGDDSSASRLHASILMASQYAAA